MLIQLDLCRLKSHKFKISSVSLLTYVNLPSNKINYLILLHKNFCKISLFSVFFFKLINYFLLFPISLFLSLFSFVFILFFKVTCGFTIFGILAELYFTSGTNIEFRLLLGVLSPEPQHASLKVHEIHLTTRSTTCQRLWRRHSHWKCNEMQRTTGRGHIGNAAIHKNELVFCLLTFLLFQCVKRVKL